MNLEQLKEVMKFQLSNFNDEGEEISSSTIHNKVLSDEDGFGNINSKNLYQDAIRFTLAKQGHGLKPWPSNWMDISVDELAPKILGETDPIEP